MQLMHNQLQENPAKILSFMGWDDVHDHKIMGVTWDWYRQRKGDRERERSNHFLLQMRLMGHDLKLSHPVKTLKEVIQKLIPRKGINSRGNTEGSALLDYNRRWNYFRTLSGGGHWYWRTKSGCPKRRKTYAKWCCTHSSSWDNFNPLTHPSLTIVDNDSDINLDFEFLDKFKEIMKIIKHWNWFFATPLNFEKRNKKQGEI